jgi:CheY-like chemotaxis protein
MHHKQEEQHQQQHHYKGKIMVVDDEEDILTIVEMALQDWGWQDIETYANPFDALAHYADKKKKRMKEEEGEEQYALVLSDIRMPGMNGFELASKILELDPNAKILLMSALEIDKTMQSLVPTIHPSEVITKPFAMHNLCTAVKERMEGIRTKEKLL